MDRQKLQLPLFTVVTNLVFTLCPVNTHTPNHATMFPLASDRSIYEIFTNLDKIHVAEFPFSLLFLCGHFIPGQIITLSFLLCLLQMPEIGSLLFVILLSDVCFCESLNIFKVNLKTFTVMCHLMYHTALSSYAFSLQGILYIM